MLVLLRKDGRYAGKSLAVRLSETGTASGRGMKITKWDVALFALLVGMALAMAAWDEYRGNLPAECATSAEFWLKGGVLDCRRQEGERR
jgi:hypothetical protein